MPINEHFQQNQIKENNVKKKVPDGVWTKCTGCKAIVYEKELLVNLMVCPKCQFHHTMSARDRINMIADERSFKEKDKGLLPVDKLAFKGEKTYKQSIKKATEKSGLNEAIISGTIKINDVDVAVGVMDFSYIGGSMGSVVGEKISRLSELSIKKRYPLVMFCTSGGARMQEGMFSLMQMSKTALSVTKVAEAKLPYIAILTNPTMGGVSASFATLADIIIAEPNALIGFAGPRVIEKTIRERLPDGFQKADFLKDNGMIDMIVARNELKETISKIINMLQEK